MEEIEKEAVALRREELSPPAPELPDGWKTLTQMKDDLSCGLIGEEMAGCTGDIQDVVQELADGAVDVYTDDLYAWIGHRENGTWMEEAKSNGLLDGAESFDKMIMAAQYECYSQDLYNHLDDSVRYAMLSDLQGTGVYAVAPETAALLDDIDCSDVCTTFENITEQAYGVLTESFGIMSERDEGDYNIVPFIPERPSAIEEVRSEEPHVTKLAACGAMRRGGLGAMLDKAEASAKAAQGDRSDQPSKTERVQDR